MNSWRQHFFPFTLLVNIHVVGVDDAVWVCVRTQKDESALNPFLLVSYDGTVSSEEDMKVVSTCKMDVHKFPFDTQSCNLSIGSALHCGGGTRACVSVWAWDVWPCSLVVEAFWFRLPPQSVNSASFPPRMSPGLRSSPGKCWGRRASGSSSTCPSPMLTSPITARLGSSSSTLWEPNCIRGLSVVQY